MSWDGRRFLLKIEKVDYVQYTRKSVYATFTSKPMRQEQPKDRKRADRRYIIATNRETTYDSAPQPLAGSSHASTFRNKTSFRLIGETDNAQRLLASQ